MTCHSWRHATTQTITAAVLALAALLAGAPAEAAPPRAGKTLLAEHDLPRDVIEKLAGARARPAPPAPGESVLVSAQMADAIEWTGPPVETVPSRNPYLVAVTVKGRARADGDVATLWRTGWNLGDAQRGSALPGLSRSQMKAGQAFEVRAVGQPLSFKEARTIAPMVGMVSASNLDIDAVHVEVWSGLASPGWRELLFSLQGALVGVVMIALLWWWRR